MHFLWKQVRSRNVPNNWIILITENVFLDANPRMSGQINVSLYFNAFQIQSEQGGSISMRFLYFQIVNMDQACMQSSIKKLR